MRPSACHSGDDPSPPKSVIKRSPSEAPSKFVSKLFYKGKSFLPEELDSNSFDEKAFR